MLTTYASYAFAVWFSFALVYFTHFLGRPHLSESEAGVYLALLPLLFIAPSVEFLIHVNASDKKAIAYYMVHRRFAALRMAMIGAVTGFLTTLALYAGWEIGWSYSQSKTMVTALLTMTIALSLVGPARGLSFVISLSKASQSVDADGSTEDTDG